MSNIVKSETQALSLFNPDQFQQLLQVAEYFSKSDLVPKQYQAIPGSEQKAIANTVIAFDMAQRMNANPLMVMQNMHVIQGRPSWSAQFIIAAINSSGRWDELDFDYFDAGEIKDIPYKEKVWDAKANQGRGAYIQQAATLKGPMQNMTCVCRTRKVGSSKELVGPEVTMEMAIREGWYTKSDSKWQTMPKIMLMYRAATFWKSVYAPDIMMGMPSTEELRDIQEVPYEDLTLDDKVKEAAKSRETIVIEKEPEQEPAPEGVDTETGEVKESEAEKKKREAAEKKAAKEAEAAQKKAEEEARLAQEKADESANAGQQSPTEPSDEEDEDSDFPSVSYN